MRPSFVVLELCETRVDSLLEPSPLELRNAVNVTLPYVLRESVRARVRRTRPPPALPPTNPPSPASLAELQGAGHGPAVVDAAQGRKDVWKQAGRGARYCSCLSSSCETNQLTN